EALLKLLAGLEPHRPGEAGDQGSVFGQLAPNTPAGSRLGMGMDSCVVPLRHGGLSLVQTTDFFYPLVEDPYMMGRIACANVLSDLYAMGITECDNMLMLLSVSQKISEKVGNLMLSVCVVEVASRVTGGASEQKTKIHEPTHLQFVRLGLFHVKQPVCSTRGGTSVTGGQTVVNPWIIVGGVASVACQPNKFIM
ncbi:unnamed protein product, partial [Coregonus sp. 'balchen']